MPTHVDVLIVGAGLSGIGAAAHVKRDLPGKTVVILESRAAIGGTWDLFRYPGVRSDSDMFTLGYSFRPWTDAQAIAPGASIREYIQATIEDEQLGEHIRLRHRVISASWCSESARWTVIAVRTGTAEFRPGQTVLEEVVFTCSFLFVCSGYYRYDEGFTPVFPGAESFEGELIHPQHWPADLDYARKRVVVVGSGATAVTLVPSLAETAAHVTMLQRSPTYIAPVASADRTADILRTYLPTQAAYGLTRAKNIGYSLFTYQLSRRRPEKMKSLLRNAAIRLLPEGFDVDTHLSPSYNPWDERLCMTPDGDLYQAITRGTADIVTDRIERITPGGIELASGRTLDADIIVSATGLNVLFLGDMTLTVDGAPIALSDTLTYKGMMLDGVPNFAMTIGYTNASWTLKADLVARYVGRTLRYMDRHHFDIVTPQADESVKTGDLVSLIDLQSGYIARSVNALPRQGAKAPWRLHQNYLRDFGLLRLGRVTNDVRFGRRGTVSPGSGIPLSLPGTAVIDIDGARVRYRVTGHGSPLLLLHGIGQSLEDWNEQHDRLSTIHTVYSVDLPGFAYSDRLPGKASLAGLAGMLPAFLDRFALTDPLPVIGNSLGGAVAMTFASAHPERVSMLVLVDSAGFGHEVTVALRLLAIRPLGALLMRPGRKNSARTVDGIFYDKKHVTSERIDHSLALTSRPAHRATLLDLAQELGTARGIRLPWRTRLLAEVARLPIPTLIMWGDHDHVLPFTHLDAAARALPHAQTHTFRDAGHMPQIENADEFADVLRGFLAQHALVASGVTHDSDAS
ncbi:alpha/beta fold hydrolase [Cryobacterium sp. CG_9.6]|uniref:alpha/beta fold hydrolase n=1 Tax=Cryobacterium sp. CG_9.6 TaxID=2760710 RepID=UPI002475E443|nr:alpha/beta fold hydrolase [Cryobacterium sp. CG_9.6]MDH6238175.1 cation diffusion facilitator CzcD-associated flavoprotein CzcO/pimeloyl-ACP methyl ester carboxylesterase [Cryobacterium sp. CG_9.6]